METTKLEKAILDYIAERNPDPRLHAQIGTLTVGSRDYTGVGAYTYFAFSSRIQANRILNPRVPYPGPNFSSTRLEHGAGSVVWCGGDGFLSCIEIFSYSDDYPPEEFDFALMTDDQ